VCKGFSANDRTAFGDFPASSRAAVPGLERKRPVFNNGLCKDQSWYHLWLATKGFCPDNHESPPAHSNVLLVAWVAFIRAGPEFQQRGDESAGVDIVRVNFFLPGAADRLVEPRE
jgi:hypothetical protein